MIQKCYSISALLQLNNSKKVYQLSEKQKESIAESQAQIKRGKYKSHQEVMKAAEKWLKEK